MFGGMLAALFAVQLVNTSRFGGGCSFAADPIYHALVFIIVIPTYVQKSQPDLTTSTPTSSPTSSKKKYRIASLTGEKSIRCGPPSPLAHIK